MEYAENIVQLLANLTALLLCLFHYVSNKSRGWLYAIGFFLCDLLSVYYWTSYLIITGDWPNVSQWMAYSGWNAAFFVLLILLMHMKSREERRYFHLLMLLPIPLNIWQLTIYLPYGSLLNNVYQVSIVTLLTCFSLQSICWYWKNRKNGVNRPHAAIAVFLFALFEFGMWTFSCLDEPFGSMYYPASFLSSINYLYIVWAIRRTYTERGLQSMTTFDRMYQRILQFSSLAGVLLFSVGGISLGIWMRDELIRQFGPDASSSANNIIPVILFVISLILVLFAVAVIFVVYFGQKAAENNELREARRIAERASAAKSEFLASMSHEIRTPINAVMGMNEMIQRESRRARDCLPGDPEAVSKTFADICGYSGIIDTAGKNLLAIINDILDISRIEAGKMELRNAPYRLSSVLDDVCNMIRFRAQSKNLSFLVDTEEQLPDHLYGDELRIRQVIMNLLTNAVKYTRSGTVTLSLRGGTGPAAGPENIINLIIAVRDTGIGIRPEDLEKIFDKFERVDLAENSRVEGTGLGLAITRRLLDMMGGSIQAESEYGRGSVFTAVIPQEIVSADPIGNYRERFEKSPSGVQNPSGLFRAPDAHILIVDDTRMNLTVAAGLLSDTEIRIDTAVTGEEALRLARTVPYDLILMDQRMPEMDGTEAMRRIRAEENSANRETPFICLTADAVSGAREKYLAEGFADYLAKPIDSLLMKKMIMAYLPPEKVNPVAPDEAPEKAAPLSAEEETALGRLRAEGLDVSGGLLHCQQDTGFYLSLLSEFAAETGEKAQRLQQLYDAENWKDYGILIHAVKSTSRMIGAVKLSEDAARLETAAKAADTETLRKEHAPLLARYRRTADILRSVCGETVSSPRDQDVMEFQPEQTV